MVKIPEIDIKTRVDAGVRLREYGMRTCFQIGHLQNSYPQARTVSKKKRRQAPKPRGSWFLDNSEDEKEEEEENQPNSNHNLLLTENQILKKGIIPNQWS